jgi:hypothetical protein
MIEYTILNKDRELLGVIESKVHEFTAEASELGFPVGQFPEKILTDMGNGQAFVRVSEIGRDGDLLWVLYRQALGCISLKVFND